MRSNAVIPIRKPRRSAFHAMPLRMNRRREQAFEAQSLGRLPLLSLIIALGLLLVAIANTGARAAEAWAEPLFWAGLLILFLPPATRLVTAAATRTERLCLVAFVGVALYCVKLLHSPIQFTFADELMHWRTANDILHHNRLFHENPLLPISPLYPGLENAVAASIELGGLGIFEAGVLALGLARLIFAFALFRFYEEASGSARVAGLGSLLYMANPNYLFFDAQFAYESLSLPLAALALYLVARHERLAAGKQRRLGLVLMVALSGATVVITHHLTAYALIAFLFVWSFSITCATWLRERRLVIGVGPGGLALFVAIASLAWSAFIANRVIGYLAPHFSGALAELVSLLRGETVGRELFRAATGFAPLWERLIGTASVVILLAMLPFGAWLIWRNHRHNALVLALGIAALSYPATLALRFTRSGAEISNRASEFVFVALAFVVALVVFRNEIPATSNHTAQNDAPHGSRLAALAAMADRFSTIGARTFRTTVFAWMPVVFLGGIIVGWAPWARMPGPYHVAADTRSIEPQGIAAAAWMLDLLGPHNRIGADRTNRLLMGAYGEQRPVTSYGDEVKLYAVYLATEINQRELEILRRGQVRYLVVDRRLSTGLPLASVYFERGERSGKPIQIFDPAALAKFERLAGAHRIFDSGDIAIYDIGAVLQEFSAREARQ